MSQRNSKMGIWGILNGFLTEDLADGWVLHGVVEDDRSSCKEATYDETQTGLDDDASASESSRLYPSTDFLRELEGNLASDTNFACRDFDGTGQPISGPGQERAMWRIRRFPEQSGLLLVFRRDPGTQVARVVHDLRTPLAAMVAAADRLLEPTEPATETPDPAVEAQTIARAGRGLLAQIDSLLGDRLDAARRPAGRWDPLAIAAEAVDLFGPAARQKGLDLGLVEFGQVRTRPGDPTPFRRILVNLIGNAVKFSDRGAVVVTVVDSGGSLRVAVRDEGPGIEPELLPRLFTAGTRGSTGVEGHGLGLANVRDLAAELGGTVRVESSPGMGSTFTVALPYESARSRLEHVRVLLVDDCEHSRRLLEHRLRSFGAEVQVAEDGFVAESLVRATPPDVLLVDLSMPGRDGAETLRILRRNGVIAPAVALTASTDDRSRTRALEAGFSLVLTKPVDPEALRRAIVDRGGTRVAA